jgi:hypothetical protein
MNRTGKRIGPRVFSVASLGAAITIAVAVGHASPARGSAATECPSLRNVVAFDGHVSETIGEAFTGSDGGGGTLTVQLGRVARNVHIHLADKRHRSTPGAPYYEFSGRTSGGNASIDDVYEDTGADYAGELKYEGAVSPAGAGVGGAVLVIDRRSCTYRLNVGFVFVATYTGDPEVDRGHLVTFGVSTSPDAHLSGPHLALYGGIAFNGPQPGCDPLLPDACAYLHSGWMPELIELYECGTTDLTNCAISDDDPHFKTPATFSWTLKPVYKKGK